MPRRPKRALIVRSQDGTRFLGNKMGHTNIVYGWVDDRARARVFQYLAVAAKLARKWGGVVEGVKP